ncbi:hypothetical protein F8R89_01905 [Streptomyces sp. SS1-1]|uniref:hypothetical protein n=1 Tax=Streptomyces sp. SS1-1 TaxID=2651869 RepID=UPI0012508F60|nr:hypothetical protein [Streptomyces sp. SS1-1]KAB2970921.1 hypothetical protein F8R89_01905 [Streptomyces sp. SS1-1]
MSAEHAMDAATAARLERFGRLPERIRVEDMTVSQPATPDGSVVDAYNSERSWIQFSCLALDMGL